MSSSRQQVGQEDGVERPNADHRQWSSHFLLKNTFLEVAPPLEERRAPRRSASVGDEARSASRSSSSSQDQQLIRLDRIILNTTPGEGSRRESRQEEDEDDEDEEEDEEEGTYLDDEEDEEKGELARSQGSQIPRERCTKEGCKPCFFFNDVSGCSAGNSCRFCHLSHNKSIGIPRMRPCKGKRDRYRKLRSRILQCVESDPNFTLESYELPQSVLENKDLYAKLAKTVARRMDEIRNGGIPCSDSSSVSFSSDSGRGGYGKSRGRGSGECGRDGRSRGSRSSGGPSTSSSSDGGPGGRKPQKTKMSL